MHTAATIVVVVPAPVSNAKAPVRTKGGSGACSACMYKRDHTTTSRSARACRAMCTAVSDSHRRARTRTYGREPWRGADVQGGASRLQVSGQGAASAERAARRRCGEISTDKCQRPLSLSRRHDCVHKKRDRGGRRSRAHAGCDTRRCTLRKTTDGHVVVARIGHHGHGRSNPNVRQYRDSHGWYIARVQAYR
jgi:hypothetical protein